MTELEQQLLKSESGNAEVRLRMRTNTYVDAGRWWRRTPLWLCLLESELIVLAVARRRYHERLAIADCADSYYCHATGELVLEPAAELTFRRFAISPRQALTFLEAIGALPAQAPAQPAPPLPPQAAPTPPADTGEDELTALLNSPELIASLTEAERLELTKLSPDEIRAMLADDDDDLDTLQDT